MTSKLLNCATLRRFAASHLWQYTGRPMDNYGLQEALETAAVTASRLYERVSTRIASQALYTCSDTD